jgi:hypothetical protein
MPMPWAVSISSFSSSGGATPRACGKEARNLISKGFTFGQFVMRLSRQKVNSQA